MNMKTKNLIRVSLFAAIMCLLSIIRLPLPSPVPFTLQILGVTMTGALLGSYLGAMAMIIYTLLGAIGLPVFSGMTGGIQVLAGPTGGYIIGFTLATFIIGMGMKYLVHRQSRPAAKFITIFLTMSAGLMASYIMGLIQLKLITGLDWSQAILVGILPFVVLDLIKIFISTILVYNIYPILLKSDLISLK